MKKLYPFLYLFVLLSIVAEGQNIPRPNIPAPQGLAVNSFTGNLFMMRNEQSLRGTGYRIYQSFYYNAALDSLNYGYGHGWSFYYHTFYVERADTVEIHRSGGRKDVFVFNSGAYRSPAGVFEVLTKSGSQFTLTAKDGEKHIFADATHKKITRMEDTNGNSVVFNYTNGKPTQITNSSGRSLLLTWTNGLLTEAKDASDPGKKYTYVYNADKDLVAVVDPLGGRKSFSYQNHRLIRLGDENNNPVVITYAGQRGKVKQITSCDSEQRFSFQKNERKTFVTQESESGKVVTGYAFDERGRLATLIDPNSDRAELTYDDDNNLTGIRDFKGLVFTYAYDNRGNVLQANDALGNKTVYTYESTFNRPLTMRDERGNTTRLTYNSKGDLTKVVEPGNKTTTFTYDAAGRRLTTTNPNNNTVSYQYNSDGDLAKIQYPEGAVQYEYNGNCCNVGKITDANGNTLNIDYDLRNRPKTLKDAQNNTIAYEYDAAGNVTKETDPNGNVKQYGYDALDRLTSVALPVGAWQYEYDGQGNLVRMTDANAHLTQFVYNKRRELVEETDALGHTVRSVYDKNGNLTERHDPNGNTVIYKYDALDRLIEKSYPGNTDKYAYDEAGNLVSAYNDHIAYSFEYDNLNRQTKKNILTWGKSLAYTYDALGNRLTMTDQDGGVTTYTYDANNRLITLKNPANLTTTFAYDAGNRLTRQTNGNGTFSTYHYDSAGRLDSLTNWKNASEKISFFYYTFDKHGNRKTMRDKRGLHSYTYDAAHRLTNVIYADGSTESFTLDGSGNRISRTKNGVTTPYTYNAADQIQTAGADTFTFDANGNTISQTSDRPRTYQYDGENRLVEVMFSNQKKVQYKYDPFGDKIEKQDTLSVVTKMLYDGDNLFNELDAANVVQNAYTTALGMNSWIAMESGGSNYFYMQDGLNSTTEITNSNSNVVNSYTYDAFGNLNLSTGSVPNNILFNGRIYEAETRLFDYKLGWYNPDIGGMTTDNPNLIDISMPEDGNGIKVNDPINGGVMIGISIGIGIISRGRGIGGVGRAIGGAIRRMGTPRNIRRGREAHEKAERAKDFAEGVAEGFEPIICAYQNQGSGYAPESNYAPQDEGGYKSPKQRDLDEQLRNIDDMIRNQRGAIRDAHAALGYAWNGTWGLFFPVDPSSDPCNPDDPKKSELPLPDSPDGPSKKIPIVAPADPNEIIGPAGYDTLQWVSSQQNLPYKVLFENDPEFATAPAQNVTVYVPIHDKLNPASLRLSDFGFGSFNFTVPPNTSIYSQRLDVRDSLGVFVDLTAGLDVANRRAFWIFQSIDPATGLAATLPASGGFLPVNDTIQRRGEGYVTFTLQAAVTAQTRDTVSAQASIIFDSEETIATNRWVNTVDAVAPVSNIGTLAAVVDSVFNVSWTSQDDANGSGVKDHILYVSKNNGPFTLYKDKLTALTEKISGEPGSSYAFYTRAADHAGNLEADKTTGDRVVTVKATSDQTCIGASLGFSTPAVAGATYRWQVDQGAGFVDLADNATYAGTTSASLTIRQVPNNYAGYRYRAQITVSGSVTYSPVRELRFASTWLGVAGDNWHNPANWSCGAIPDQYTDVTVSGNVPSTPTLNTDGICRSLSMDEQGAIAIKQSANLRLGGL
jgi:YD repeat-containing protein